MAEVASISELVRDIRPYVGQSAAIVYTVYTDRTMRTKADLSAWATTVWTLFADVDDAAATLAVAGVISAAASTITVSITEAQMGALVADTRYMMQLWRNESGNKYPLTGFDNLIPEAAPPLT